MQFPVDHGAHPSYTQEWWYLTGFLQGAGGQRTFQLTFFRYRPEPGSWDANPSAFTPRQLMMGQAAMAEPGRGRFQSWQRLGRVGLGLAWAKTGGLDVGVRDWRLWSDGPVWRCRIVLDDQQWRLRFRPPLDPVLHGDHGLLPRGGDRVSHYYSFPMVEVDGELVVDGRSEPVHGRAWMDHEWSEQAFDRHPERWDWVGLRLAGGGALMAYRFRDDSGRARFVAGTWVDPSGTAHRLGEAGEGELDMQPGSRVWRSPKTGAVYPIEWTLHAPPGVLRVEALLPDQEIDAAIGPRYWEGAVRVSGERDGEGFLEMTGYRDPGGLPAAAGVAD